MGKLYYLMGKSSTGKDTIYKRLIDDDTLELKTIVGYTTRPRREGEIEGLEYHFVTAREHRQYENDGLVIERRKYDTVYGPWVYFTVDDGNIDLEKNDYIQIGTLESYVNVKSYFGKEKIVPLYINVEDGERLTRALYREKAQDFPRYAEMCRRFLADEEDFSVEKLENAGIVKTYENSDINRCIEEIRGVIFRNKLL